VYLEIFELFFRVGSLSFGGGVVIVPMLQAEVVPKWMTDEQFFQGLALSQSLPGPVFNYASFLGGTYAGFLGALVASVALTGPGFILIYSTLPFWINLRGSAAFKAIIQGLNASSIGMIGGSCVFLYAMSVKNAAGAIVFVLCAGLNAYYGVGAPQTIAAGAVVGALFSTFSLGQVPY
jgi:chromate transporter